jgi:hypothetical protein
MTTQTHQWSRPPSATTVEAEALLKRYPNISETELAKLINLFPHIRILDLAMMTCDDRLAGKLDRFRRDHRARLKAPLSSLVVVLAVPTILLVAGLLWWALAPATGM